MKTFTMDVAGRELKATIGKVAAQANGAVFLQYGETTLLCTATASDNWTVSLKVDAHTTPSASVTAKSIFVS